MNIETAEWDGNAKKFAELLFDRIRTALKEQLKNAPEDKHIKLIRDAGKAFAMRLDGASYDYARNPAGQKIVDNLQSEYASRFEDMEY